MASKPDRSNLVGSKRRIALILLIVAVIIALPLCFQGYREFHAWNLERLMRFYKVRQNFPTVEGQSLIAQVIQGEINDVLMTAKSVPGGVNATGTDGLTPLRVAVFRLNLSMVRALLKAGANPDGDPRQTPLEMAVKAYDLTIARTLLEAGANPDGPPGSEPPLLEAATINYREAVDLLLSAGAHIDAPDPLGYTASIDAALAGHLDMTDYLLDRGGSLWVTEKLGITIPILLNGAPTQPKIIEAQQHLIARYKAAHWPWPPPSSKEVKTLMDEGKWPPKDAIGATP